MRKLEMNRKRKIKQFALDTNVFIYFFENNVELGQKAKAIFEGLSQNQLKAVTNITSLAELLSSPKLTGQAVRETKKLFLSVPNLEIYGLDESIAIKSAEIRREYGFRLLDAIQLATALIAKTQAFITNDHRLKSFKQLKIISLSDLA
ncbi:type II toxin-antitoxin system VapC family toxin [Candidatus Daviesbacteria bacterium]|nr:type II toxin-antitoxin system VapC family toxin [Candidatus Daviesbacteria bacterium]